MKNAMGLVTLLLCLLAASLLTVPVAKSEAAATDDPPAIINTFGYIDPFGHYHVLGEVENRAEQAVEAWTVNATFYATNGSLIYSQIFETSKTSAALTTINPGKKSPFETVLEEEALATQVDHYSVTVGSFRMTPSKPSALQIENGSSYTDAFKNMIVTGAIKNAGSQTAESVKILATFYNSEQRVIATAFSYKPGNRLAPNESLTFQIELASADFAAKNVTSYALEAESDEYALIPEFPALIMPLTLIILTLGALLTTPEAAPSKTRHQKPNTPPRHTQRRLMAHRIGRARNPGKDSETYPAMIPR